MKGKASEVSVQGSFTVEGQHPTSAFKHPSLDLGPALVYREAGRLSHGGPPSWTEVCLLLLPVLVL